MSATSPQSSVLSSQKHGLVIIPDGTPNGDVNHEPLSSGITVVSQEAAQVLESAGEGPLGESNELYPERTEPRVCSVQLFLTQDYK